MTKQQDSQNNINNLDLIRLEDEQNLSEDGGPVRAQIIIKRIRAKGRIDKYLQGRFPRFSRSAIQKLIKEGTITVNNKIVKPSYEILPGDVIDLLLPVHRDKEITPENIPLDIIYEDKYLIIVNKPPNMVVHPARGYQSGTMVNALAYYCQNLSSGDDPVRPGVIHRLDKDTTGVIIFAKDDEAHWRLAMQFERRRIHKEYLAVVEGIIQLDSDRIDAPIGAHPQIRSKYSVRESIGRQAITVYHVIERLKNFTFVKLHPETGRTHQLRVHMSYIKHPIVGDTMYGARKITKGQLLGCDDDTPIIERFALHAHRIEFRHPITGKPMQIEAPLPDDFKNILETLRQYKNTNQK